LKEIKKFYNVEIVLGYDGRRGVFPGIEKINQRSNEIYLGRVIFTTEAACLLSHWKAISESKTDWTVILEDDVQIIDLSHLIRFCKDLNRKSSNTLEILLLYKGAGGIFSRHKKYKYGDQNFSKVLDLPTTTRAYVVNRKVSQLAQNQLFFTGTADWPTWIAPIYFYQSWQDFISHDGALSSMIDKQTDAVREVWPKFRKSLPRMLLALFIRRYRLTAGGYLSFTRLLILPKFYRAIYRFDTNERFLSSQLNIEVKDEI
jgi:hypothetical protein